VLRRDHRSAAHRADIATDTSGSMLAMGIPIALVLTGLVWYMVGVGNAVAEAEGVRLGADKAAYEAAVWHARGMNVIATLNLLMTSLASVLVAWRAFQETIRTAATICFIDSSCDAVVAANLVEQINKADPAVNGWLDAQIKTIGDLERLTATVTPTIAFNNKTPVTGLVSYSIPYSTAMVPDSRIASVMGPVSTPRWGLSNSLPALPIQVALQADFCAAAGPPVAEVAELLLDGIHAPWVIPLLKAHNIDYVGEWTALGKSSGCLGIGGEAAGIWDAGTAAHPGYQFAFQVYGFAFGKDAAHGIDDQNVSTLVGDGNAAPTAQTAWTASAADFFFPCTTTWATCAAPSLFEPSWQARLQRVRPPPGGADVLGSIAGNLVSSASGNAAAVLGSGAIWTRVADLIH